MASDRARSRSISQRCWSAVETAGSCRSGGVQLWAVAEAGRADKAKVREIRAIGARIA